MYQPPWSPMKKNLNQDFVVGVDAGGTRIRAILACATAGSALTEGAAGPGNALTVPLPELTDHLATAVAEAVPPELRDRVAVVTAGFAGAARTSADEPGRLAADAALHAALRRLGISPAVTEIYSDIEVAFASAPGAPADGLALVAGTGAVAARITARGCAATADGNGWLLGDDGSGFWIGRSAVLAALRMADGRGGPTMLVDSVARALLAPDSVPSTQPDSWSEKAREAYRMWLVPAVMAEPPIRLARLAPLVADAAARGDAVAGAILEEAAWLLTATVRALDPRPGERLVVTGGLLGPDGPLTNGLDRRLTRLGLRVDWAEDGRRGAVALARLTHEAVRR
jgi:N-acetylglucosamine kinase-like BadF-type ATPase